MASNKLHVNLVFALVVAILGLTAITFSYMNLRGPHIRPDPERDLSGGSLPENHPAIDAANRLAALEQMSAKDPKNAEYLTQIANIYYDLGKYDKAAEVYQKSLDIRPRDPNVETDLAACFHYLGRYDQALEILDKVIEYSPNFPQAMFNKGIVLAGGKKNIKGGIAVWEDLLRSNPDFSKKAELERRINELKASAK